MCAWKMLEEMRPKNGNKTYEIMRIGILTLPLHTNYGGILQAYALQTVLKRMGHEVVVFDKPYDCIKQG